MDWMTSTVKLGMQLLKDAGFEVYLVGGCVRDHLMRKTPHDYDLTTNAEPEQIHKVFAEYRVIETGKRHGTMTIMIGQTPLEITTYRIDGTYTDARHPDRVEFTGNLKEDLRRRDFTMNAMAYHPEKGLVDLFFGQSDIEKQLIRCVGVPDTRFQEDALRILRALRFASVLGFHIEAETEAAMFRHKARLASVSPERVSVELTKLLCGKDVKRVLLTYVEVLGVVIPELLPMKGFEQRTKYHIYDVLTHTAVALEQSPPKKILRWTLLLHDCGKPETFTIDEYGIGHFPDHNKVSAELAERVLCRLKFDRTTKERIVSLVRVHDVKLETDRKMLRHCINRLSPEAYFDLLEVKYADNKAQSPQYERQKSYFDTLRTMAHTILREDCIYLSDLAVNGRDLASKGYQGREIGQMLQVLLDAVMEEKIENNPRALMCYAEKLEQNLE